MNPRSSLTRRLVTLTVVVAGASVLVTGVATLGLYRAGAREAAETALGRDADIVAALLGDLRGGVIAPRTGQERQRVTGLRNQLSRREITSALAGGDAVVDPPFSAGDVDSVGQAGALSTARSVAGTEWLIEGRAVDDARASVVLLAQPVSRAIEDTAPPRRRLLLALLLGLVGGAVAGLVLARQIARPLARLAGAARWLSAGRRDVRVPVDGPAEVADAAQALNTLAAALDDSEQRQRRFLLMVSHELRTPLTAVTGYAEALADGVLPAEETAQAGGVIRDEAARLQRRVEDLLALARMEADDFRVELADADLVALARAAGRAWEPRAEAAGVRMMVDTPDQPVVLRTDTERVRQAVDALLDNALRVLPPGVPLVLAVRPVGRDVRVEVRDGGPGLSAQDLAVAFERGRLTERYRGDRPVGSGLGLALVGALARRLGGVAEAYPAPEGGVAFALVLPAEPPSIPAPSPAPTLAESDLWQVIGRS